MQSSYEVPLFFDPAAQRSASTSSSSIAARRRTLTARPSSASSSSTSAAQSPFASPRRDDDDAGSDWTGSLEGMKEPDEDMDVTAVERELNKRTRELSFMAKKSVDDLRAVVMASQIDEPLPPLPQTPALDELHKISKSEEVENKSSGSSSSSSGGSSGNNGAGKRTKKRPTRLQLAETNYDEAPRRDSPATSMPVSVSYGSQLTLQAASKASPHGSAHTKKTVSSSRVHSPLTPSMPPSPARRHLYAKADEIFPRAYSVSPTSPHATLHSPTSATMPAAPVGTVGTTTAMREREWSDAGDLARSQSRFSDGTEDSHNSTPLFCDDSVSSRASSVHPPPPQQPSLTTTKPLQHQLQNPLLAGLDEYYYPRRAPVSPRVVAQAGRPSTSDAAVHLANSTSPPQSPSGVRFVRHNHSSSDQEALRRFVEEEEEPLRHRPRHQLQIVESPPLTDFKGAMSSSSPPPGSGSANGNGNSNTTGSSKKSISLGSRLRAVSTPKLRHTSSGWRLFGAGSPPAEAAPPLPTPESRPASASTNQSGPAASSPTVATRPGSSTTRIYPPQAPSGRFRSRTIGEADDGRRRSNGSNKSSILNNTGSSSHGGDDEAGPTPQRPRRPSSTEAIAAVARRLRRPSKAETYSSSVNSSVHSFLNASHSSGQIIATSPAAAAPPSSTPVSTVASTTKAAKVAPPKSPASRPKSSKGGWASHLHEGLTLHVDHGGHRSFVKLAYLAYEPFTRPEMLCPAVLDERPATPKRPKSKGADGPSSSPYNKAEELGALEYGPADIATPIMLEAGSEEVVIKHLTLGDDTKGDLLTRQATLSTRIDGTHEVSGCERKGRLAWRCVYSIDQRTLRIVGFFCSGELVDSNRAKKSKLISGIRKQMAPNLQSMQILGASPAGSSTMPLVDSPTSSHPSGGPSSLARPGGATSTSTWSPASMASRQLDSSPQSVPGNLPPGVVPFKMSSSTTRSQSRPPPAATSSASSSATSPVTPGNRSLLLPSPLSSHFATLQHQPPSITSDGTEEEKLQPPTGTRRRGHSFGEAARGLAVPVPSRPGQGGAGALGLDVSATKGASLHPSRQTQEQQQRQQQQQQQQHLLHQRQRVLSQARDGAAEYGQRVRAATSGEPASSLRSFSSARQTPSPSRPPTASEEIKLAYLGTAAAFRELGLDDEMLSADEGDAEARKAPTRPLTADVFVRPGRVPASPHRANVEVHSGLLKGTAKPLPPPPSSLMVDERPRTTSSIPPGQRFGLPSASPELMRRWL